MEKEFDRSRGRSWLKVRVTNIETGRIDYHSKLSKYDIGWIETNPNLKVEVLEVAMKRREGSYDR